MNKKSYLKVATHRGLRSLMAGLFLINPASLFAQTMVAEKADMQDLLDHKAQVANVEGKVQIMKKGTLVWNDVAKGMVIEEGDVLLTQEKASVDIAYDRYFLNIARIDQKTRAEFKTIEPTDVHLEDGSVFSALDGLTAGTGYQVSTPTAIAAVRGTHFSVKFDAVSGDFMSATIPVEGDDHKSVIELTDLLPDGSKGQSLLLDEGKQVSFNLEKPLSAELLMPIENNVLQQGQQVFEKMGDKVENFDAMRNQGRQDLEPMMERDRDENMLGNVPPGGGNPPNGPQGGNHLEGGEHRLPPLQGDRDPLVDALIPNGANNPMDPGLGDKLPLVGDLPGSSPREFPNMPFPPGVPQGPPLSGGAGHFPGPHHHEPGTMPPMDPQTNPVLPVPGPGDIPGQQPPPPPAGSQNQEPKDPPAGGYQPPP